jgi:DNA-binding protein H-NS
MGLTEPAAAPRQGGSLQAATGQAGPVVRLRSGHFAPRSATIAVGHCDRRVPVAIDTGKRDMKTRIVDDEARDRLILWLRRRMDEFGITVEALAASIAEDRLYPPIYRDARGNEWNGQGDMPGWLRAAQNAGVDPAFFSIEAKPAELESGSGAEQQRTRNDARQLDLFV